MEDLFETLQRHGHARPDADAIVDGPVRILWEALPQQVDNLCLGLVQQGMRPGKAVALLLDRTRHLALTFLAILRGKAVAAPLEAGMGRDHLVQALHGSRPELLIYDAAHEALANELLEHRTVRAAIRIGGEGGAEGRIDWEHLTEADARGARFPELTPDAQVYHHWALEEGGRMRAVIGTVRNLLLTAHSAARLFGLTPEDRHLSLLPPGLRLFDHVLRPLVTGGALLCRTGNNPRRIVETASEEGATVLQAPPYLVRLVCDWVEATGQALPDLRILQSCGHTSPWVVRRVQAVLDRPLHVTWSAVETLGAALGPRLEEHSAAPLRNQPCPGLLVRICDTEGQPALEGAAGELRLRGGMIAPERLDPEGNRTPTRNRSGWLQPGIRGGHSLAGGMELLGGPADLLRRQRQPVLLRETEHCLEQHRGVMAAAVVAVPRPGDAPPLLAAIAQPDPGNPPDVETLQNYLARRLKPVQTPDAVFLARRLPHLPLGRIDRARLAEGLARRLAEKAGRGARGG